MRRLHTWYYRDALGTVLARRPHWSKVQVLRGGSDDCPAEGIERPSRHLGVVR